MYLLLINFNQYSLINILTYTNTRFFKNRRLIHAKFIVSNYTKIISKIHEIHNTQK